MREKSCTFLSGLWIPPVLNGQVQFERRWAILRIAMAIDGRALLRIVRVLAAPMTDPIRVHFWHPLLNVTRPVRRALGLRQRSVMPALKEPTPGHEKVLKP
jgi:hypothetical protein